MDFIDTNIIVYANDRRDPEKQKRAIEIVKSAIMDGNAAISIQVLQEYANTALNKLNQQRSVVLNQLSLLAQINVVESDPQMVSRAVELTALFQLSFWDASIVAAAEAAGCRNLLSEDLNPGQSYGSVRVVNPLSS